MTPRIAVITTVLGLLLSGCGPSEPPVAGGTPDLRRLTEAQYRNIIADVFGSGIRFGGRFDPLVRTEGLLALGARSAPITASGFEQLEQLARAIADQVTSPTNRPTLVGCGLAVPATFDEPCARTFLGRVGRLLFRRPLSDAELALRVEAVRQGTTDLGDFHRGLSSALASMLVAPQFLYVVDSTEPDPSQPSQIRLDAYATASRLSFFLWNTTPDDDLLTAAADGRLHTADERGAHIDRMLASPKVKNGVRAFFADMLAFAAFDTLEKDSIIYPAFSLAVADDAREQTLRTIEDTLITRGEDYRVLFTTTKTAMSSALARVYRVPMTKTGNWAPFDFAGDPARVGIQSQIAFTAINAHPGRSSPTLRGKAIRELLLCQKIPDPPGDVDFSKFSDPESPSKTARDRLAMHSTEPSCAGCHKLTDPLGLALETFDGAGQHRDDERGVAIDTSGELDGIAFTDAAGLGLAIRDNPATTACVVNRLYSFAIGRAVDLNDKPILGFLADRFASEGYRFTALLRDIAASQAFTAVSAPAGAKEGRS